MPAKPIPGTLIDWSEPLARGLYGAWPMSSGVGPPRDHARSNTLNLVGSPTWAAGPLGPAIALPGTNGNYLQTAGAIFDPSTTDFTLSIWFLVTSVSNGPVLLQTAGGTGTTVQFLLCTTGGALKSSYGGNLFSPNGSVTLNTWHHAAYTLSGTAQTLYLDGARASGGTSTRPSISGANLNVGATNLGASAFGGLVDDLTVWHLALTAADVRLVYADRSRIYRRRRTIALDYAPAPSGGIAPGVLMYLRRRRAG